jgi:hypothetical protein
MKAAVVVPRIGGKWEVREVPTLNLHTGYLDLREAISMEKRYFTSDLSILS